MTEIRGEEGPERVYLPTGTTLHTDEAHRVISDELVRCTLGQARHPELRVGLVGAVARLGHTVERAFRALAEAFKRMT